MLKRIKDHKQNMKNSQIKSMMNKLIIKLMMNKISTSN